MKPTYYLSKKLLTIMALVVMSTTIFAQTDVAKLMREANEGNVRSMCQLALCYQNGDGVGKDATQAVNLMSKAAALGDSVAMTNLGDYYRDGFGVQQNLETAFAWYEAAAQNGDPVGMFQAGLCYAKGQGTARNDEWAARWYEKAALRDQCDAMCNLGVLYYEGKGVEQNFAKSRGWYHGAAVLGQAAAMQNYAACCENGEGGPRDLEQAKMWYERAANLGRSYSAYRLAVIYGREYSLHKQLKWLREAAFMGYGQAVADLADICSSLDEDDALVYSSFFEDEKPKEKAKTWKAILEDMRSKSKTLSKITARAEKGDRDAMFYLSLCYFNGWTGVQDDAKAAQWAEKAAEKGLAAACFSIGNKYRTGMGVVKDEKKAALYYKMAVDLHDIFDDTFWKAKCMNNLGLCYSQGIGVPQDKEKAVSYYRQAAELGECYAMNNLAHCYDMGKGIKVDYNEAKNWFLSSAEYGCQKANYNLPIADYHLGKQYFEAGNYEKAAFYLELAADNWHNPIPQAMTLLAGCYEYGYGGEVDIQQAKRWREQAKRYNDEDARRALEIVSAQ